ncbi:MAG: hypothetical protein ACRD5L_17085 [Bryobacteraceae bacterium]
MSDLEIRAIARLADCRMRPGSWEKKFVRDLWHLLRRDSKIELTRKQKLWVWRLVWRFRRQIRVEDPATVAASREMAAYDDQPPLFR